MPCPSKKGSEKQFLESRDEFDWEELCAVLGLLESLDVADRKSHSGASKDAFQGTDSPETLSVRQTVRVSQSVWNRQSVDESRNSHDIDPCGCMWVSEFNTRTQPTSPKV